MSYALHCCREWSRQILWLFKAGPKKKKKINQTNNWNLKWCAANIPGGRKFKKKKKRNVAKTKAERFGNFSYSGWLTCISPCWLHLMTFIQKHARIRIGASPRIRQTKAKRPLVFLGFMTQTTVCTRRSSVLLLHFYILFIFLINIDSTLLEKLTSPPTHRCPILTECSWLKKA